MSVFKEPLLDAIVVFPLICLILYFPFTLYQYHRYGQVTLWHTLITFSFIFYLTSAFFVVNFPLPSEKYIQHLITIDYPTMNLDPLKIVKSFLTNNPIMHGGRLITGLRDTTVSQVILNIILTMPFGIYLRLYYKKSLAMTLLLTVTLTSFFEITQLTGLYHIYARPYRLFDVDDLILNTLGGILGWFFVPLLSSILPSRQRMMRSIGNQNRITFVRQTMSFTLNIGLNVISCILLHNIFPNHLATINLISNLVIWGIIPALTSATIGEHIMKTVTKTQSIKNWHTLLRHLSLISCINFILPLWMNMLRKLV
ncbi:VanZ family protein [Weissella fangxianensis]|uniref:VanZ family protein n=1 Tax=Weissella fangxianensis TaxID=2953879 RepID=UPI0021573FD4|nr:VanZ family protein [Weissella fangxianensis]